MPIVNLPIENQPIVWARGLSIRDISDTPNAKMDIRAGNTWFHLGTGVAGAFVDGIPPLYTINNTTDDYDEYDLPQWEVLATITAYGDAGAATALSCQIEVDEIG